MLRFGARLIRAGTGSFPPLTPTSDGLSVSDKPAPVTAGRGLRTIFAVFRSRYSEVLTRWLQAIAFVHPSCSSNKKICRASLAVHRGTSRSSVSIIGPSVFSSDAWAQPTRESSDAERKAAAARAGWRPNHGGDPSSSRRDPRPQLARVLPLAVRGPAEASQGARSRRSACIHSHLYNAGQPRQQGPERGAGAFCEKGYRAVSGNAPRRGREGPHRIALARS